ATLVTACPPRLGYVSRAGSSVSSPRLSRATWPPWSAAVCAATPSYVSVWEPTVTDSPGASVTWADRCHTCDATRPAATTRRPAWARSAPYRRRFRASTLAAASGHGPARPRADAAPRPYSARHVDSPAATRGRATSAPGWRTPATRRA